MADGDIVFNPAPNCFSADLKHTRESRIFADIWENPEHPRHRQYHDAAHPKLWACRCFPLEDGPMDPWDEEETRDACRCARPYVIYAYLGGGAAGRVFAARLKFTDADGTRQCNHFAVKIMKWSDEDKNNPSSTVQLVSSDPARQHIALLRFLKMETVMQNLVGDMTANIPEVFGVYSHKPHVLMITNLLAYKHEESLDNARRIGKPATWIFEEDEERFDLLPQLNPCSGEVFEKDHQAVELRASSQSGSRSLGETVEAQMCMIFHGLLQSFHHIFDRGVTHLDFEARNILVDQKFQGYLIDFSMARPNGSESDYHFQEVWSFMRQHHDPEFNNPGLLPAGCIQFDGRRLDMWSFASVLYLLLHKAHPKRYAKYQKHKFSLKTRTRILARQIRDPIDVRENLSQDCSDVLQAALNIFPKSRPNVEELCTFPWFGGWQLGSDVDFTNPHITPYTTRKRRPLDEEDEWEDPAYTRKKRRVPSSSPDYESD